MSDEKLEELKKWRKGLSSLSDDELILAGEQLQNVVYQAVTLERERRAREEQHKLNKKIVWITVIGTITGTIIGALISTATSYFFMPKPIRVTKHIYFHKIFKSTEGIIHEKEGVKGRVENQKGHILKNKY